MDVNIKNLTKSGKRIEIHKNLPRVPFSMNCIGKSMSGKSNLIINLLSFYKKTFKKGGVYVFTKTFNAEFEKMKNVEVYYDMEIEPSQENNYATGNRVEHLLAYQKKIRESGKKPDQMLLIFDDFIVDSSFNRRRGIYSKLFAMARHYNISVLITSQNYMMIPKSIREMSMYSICFKIFGTKERQAFIEENHRDMNEDEMEVVFDAATKKKYDFLYIDAAQDKFMRNFETILHKE